MEQHPVTSRNWCHLMTAGDNFFPSCSEMWLAQKLVFQRESHKLHERFGLWHFCEPPSCDMSGWVLARLCLAQWFAKPNSLRQIWPRASFLCTGLPVNFVCVLLWSCALTCLITQGLCTLYLCRPFPCYVTIIVSQTSGWQTMVGCHPSRQNQKNNSQSTCITKNHAVVKSIE